MCRQFPFFSACNMGVARGWGWCSSRKGLMRKTLMMYPVCSFMTGQSLLRLTEICSKCKHSDCISTGNLISQCTSCVLLLNITHWCLPIITVSCVSLTLREHAHEGQFVCLSLLKNTAQSKAFVPRTTESVFVLLGEMLSTVYFNSNTVRMKFGVHGSGVD